MRRVFTDQAVAETRRLTRSPRSLGWVLPKALVKWRVDGTTVSATLTVTDDFNGKVVYTTSISNGGDDSGEINLPYTYTVALSGISGTDVAIDVAIDGDAGTSGEVV